MTASDVIDLTTPVTDTITDSALGALPLVLTIFGALVALGLVIHFVRRFIGRRA